MLQRFSCSFFLFKPPWFKQIILNAVSCIFHKTNKILVLVINEFGISIRIISDNQK